ncbi:MAG TPA: hypothetical protein VD866_17715 [Urbifossiella sp.]|nr:hypothetical protein [Urbifossiella sp.]
MKIIGLKESAKCPLTGKVGKCVVVEMGDGRTRTLSFKGLEKACDMEFADDLGDEEPASVPAPKLTA